MFDCIIVGAGPAGGTAAYHLAKRGRSVLILEKESLPRYKPCSGGVSPAIAKWFDFDLGPAISLKVKKIRYTWQLGDPIELELPGEDGVWMVRRDRFDGFLIEKAQEQGAKTQDQTEVTGIKFSGGSWQIATDREPVSGRYLIAADGAKGPLAKWLGSKKAKTRLSASVDIQSSILPTNNSSIHFDFGGKKIKNGFIWNFPNAEGYSISTATFIGGEPKDFNSVLSEYSQTVGIDIINRQESEYPLRLWDGEGKLHAQNAVIAGEAASLVDPLMGEGIRPSIFSGMKAAEAIDAALGGDLNALEKYTEVVIREWGEDLKWAGRLAGAFYRFPGLGYKGVIKRPAATQIMSRILCGKARYSEVADKAIKSFMPGK